MTAVDTTNLTISFVAPASGNVLVELTGNNSSSAASTNTYWGIATHNTTTVQGSLAIPSNGTVSLNITTRHYVSGLTAGTTYQYDWIFASIAGQTDTILIQTKATASGSGSPAIMRVLAV